MASVIFYLFAMFAAAFAASLVQGQKGDSLFANGSLLNDQTLVSDGGIFQLGFFSLDSSGLYYLGVWYKDIPPIPTVIWVANKGKPVNNSRNLHLTSSGNLIILNNTRGIHWQTGTSGTNPFVQLLNTGNLVLSGGKSLSVLWQSFDDPFDTHLPGMKLGIDLRSNHNRYLTSWRSPQDPSPGDCTYKISLSGVPEFYLSENGIPLYRNGPWTGKTFSGRPAMDSDSFKFEFVSNQLEVYYNVQILDSSMLFRAVLNASSRQLERYRWSSSDPAWKLLMIPYNEPCDKYAYCGAHGVCIPSSTVCKCLNGFDPKSQEDWKLKAFSSGCVRKTSLDCQAGDGFLLEQHVKLPDTSNATSSNRSLDECRDWCLKNCKCTAYNFNEGSGCITWTGVLIDLRTSIDGGDNLYYRVAASELAARKKKPILLIVIVSFAGFAFLICTALLLLKKYMGKDSGLLDMQNLILYDLTSIEVATNNFSIDNKLGMGCFGEVYKGQLKDGQQVAAKKLSKSSMQGTNEFKNEVLLITQLQHRNLVQLLGCCVECEERILIYEHMENKSLDTFIFDKSRSMLLNWHKRLAIIFGIARGLLYLHEDSRLNVIHRDLKPSNILLDKEMNPKISDFGIAAIFERDKSKNGTATKVVGTMGYMAPEYVKRGIYSVKSDVFSFGVIVLEMLSGRRNNLVEPGQPFVNLLVDAWRLWQDGRSLELLDESLEGSCPVSQVARCIQVGLLCVQEKSEDRPTMEEVYRMLGSDGLPLPNPKPAIPIEATGSQETPCSCNAITITIEAR